LQRKSKIKEKEVESEGKLSTAGWEVGEEQSIPRWKGGNRLGEHWAGDAKLAKSANLSQSEARESSNGQGEILRGAGNQ
jgi:hypothetical protein